MTILRCTQLFHAFLTYIPYGQLFILGISNKISMDIGPNNNNNSIRLYLIVSKGKAVADPREGRGGRSPPPLDWDQKKIS